MDVRVEKFQGPAPWFLTMLGLVSTTTAALLHRWQRPATMVMSEEWMKDRAHIDSKKGAY